MSACAAAGAISAIAAVASAVRTSCDDDMSLPSDSRQWASTLAPAAELNRKYAACRGDDKSVVWLVDAMNVIGSRPDGWWRDRDGAVRRLVAEVQAWAESGGERVIVVLDAGPLDLVGDHGPVRVVQAARRGRDAADDEIVELVAPGDTVVSSDADLSTRVRARGARVEGAGRFRRRALASAP